MLADMQLPNDVEAELTDSRFLTMSHYSSGPYDLGCRGPLCQLYKRDKMRSVSVRRALAKGKIYKPNYKLRNQLVPENRDEELYRIIIAHRIERKSFRFIKSDMRRTG